MAGSWNSYELAQTFNTGSDTYGPAASFTEIAEAALKRLGAIDVRTKASSGYPYNNNIYGEASFKALTASSQKDPQVALKSVRIVGYEKCTLAVAVIDAILKKTGYKVTSRSAPCTSRTHGYHYLVEVPVELSLDSSSS